ncbi:cytochrome P450 2J5-like isoform X1 [Anneissia japonica]|uniref:cytochrome P450 2J5-like isoform X1 n=1 Tax=Anneissia japonica TaxID=1529436 RepID=UPI0014256738|nr:cytochrome P450 2J5-like isoform X1 [Anneissia japonica]
MAIDPGFFTTGLLLGLIALFLLISHLRKRWPTTNFPPGPRGLPFVGSMLSLSPSVHLDLHKYRKTYGDIFSLMLGDSVVVVMNSAALVKEVLRRTQSSNRIYFWSQSQFSNPHRQGIFDLLYGDKWQTQRQFAVRTLRDFGFGKRSMEHQIAEEVKTMISTLKKKADESVDMKVLLSTSVSNVMCKLIFNQRFDHKDKEFLMILDLINKAFLSQGRAYDFIPILRLFQRKKIASDRKIWESFYAYIAHQIKVHRQTFQQDDTRDFIDAAIIQEEVDPVNFNDEELKLNVTNLFMAGTETISSTLSWAMLYMGINQDIQEKVFLEIKNVSLHLNFNIHTKAYILSLSYISR